MELAEQLVELVKLFINAAVDIAGRIEVEVWVEIQ